jgi:hypothetical protein
LSNAIFFSLDPQAMFLNFPLQYFWFAKIVTLKISLKDCDLNRSYISDRKFSNASIKNSYMDGIIYKRSQVFKNWELRYIVINAEGLFSYKDENHSSSFSIKKNMVTELWTRFEIYERMLVIKIHHGGIKT